MLRQLVFTAVSLAIHGALAYYLWRRLVRDTGMPRAWRRVATIAIIVLELLIPATIWMTRLGHATTASILSWPAFVWLAWFGLTVVALGVIDLTRAALRTIAWLRRRATRADEPPPDPARRQALARLTGGAAALVAAGEVALGAREVLGEHRVVDVPVTIARLPAALDGFTIVQVTDVHAGLTIGRGFLADIAAKVNALRPDLIAVTGDLVDGHVDEIGDRVAPFSELRAPHGVFFVTGNHEYYSGVEPWLTHLRTLGLRVLRNERVTIERDGAAFDLAGIDDHSAADFGGGHGADLPRALAGRDASRALVLLAHQPRQVHEAVAHGVDLQLSGHTHGGQIWPWHHIAALQQGGLLAGLYRLGDTQLYVSRGTGYWGPPVRVGAPAEITRVILRSPSP